MRDELAGQCELCGGDVAEVRKIGSFSVRGGGGGFMFAGRCSACDVDYRLNLPDRQSVGWWLDAPEPAELRREIGPGELDALSARLARYATLGPKWQAFLARRRAGDAVWQFGSADGLHNGFAVVRGGRPVSRFVTFGPVPQRTPNRAPHSVGGKG